MFDIKCTDRRHPSRENHLNSRVRDQWNNGVMGTTSVKRVVGEYAEICPGCALANRVDDVQEFKAGKTVEERITALESR